MKKKAAVSLPLNWQRPYINQRSRLDGYSWQGVTTSRHSARPKAKVRVFYAEVEGSDESVQEALKTMLAMSRPARVISEQKANGNAAVLLQHGDVEAVEEAIDQVDGVETAEEQSAPPPNARKPRGTGKKVDRNAGLSWCQT
jgi:hypothetical protein